MLIKKPDMQKFEELKKKIMPVLIKHDVVHAGIFGSTATGEENETSDVDLLVELVDGKTLFDLVALKLDLEEAVNRKVDVVTYRSLHPLIKESVLEEEIKIL